MPKTKYDMNDFANRIYIINREMGEVRQECRLIKWVLGLLFVFDVAQIGLILSYVM